MIGLWFTLRTHAAVIWSTELEEKKPPLAPSNMTQNGTISHQLLHTHQQAASKSHIARNSGGSAGHTSIRDSQLYKKILGQSLKQSGLGMRNVSDSHIVSTSSSAPHGPSDYPPFIVPPKNGGGETAIGPDHSSQQNMPVAGLSQEENSTLVRTVAEIAATAAAVAARDATRSPLRTSISAQTVAHHSLRPAIAHSTPIPEVNEENITAEVATHTEGGGHDAPNWSKRKSSIILLGATILYAIIAEILVNTVDVVLASIDVDEKFLGITLFALVPNTTEFLVRLIPNNALMKLTAKAKNAISFAMNGNIALSMEIGSAYALQVCLLQIPALVLFSAIHGRYLSSTDMLTHTFKQVLRSSFGKHANRA